MCFVPCGVLRFSGRNEQNGPHGVKTKKYDHKLHLNVNTSFRTGNQFRWNVLAEENFRLVIRNNNGKHRNGYVNMFSKNNEEKRFY